MPENYYELLGLSQGASDSDIKRSYKKLARTYHPDNRETGDENMFKKIGEAYAILSDPDKRALYDRVGHEAFTQSGGGRGYSPMGDEIIDDLHSVFESFFGTNFGAGSQARSRNTRQRGADLQIGLEIEFMEAAFGAQKTTTYQRQVLCGACHGNGSDPATPPKTCQTCQGRGEVRRTSQSFLGMVTQVTTCPTCAGNGKIITSPCRVCAGKGRNIEKSEIEITVPKGVDENSRLVWRGKGHDGKNGGPPGDLYVVLKIKPHTRLKRKGLDVFEEKEISVWQAILGDELSIETIHGEHQISVKPGTQSNTKLVLSGMGVWLDNGQHGNHQVELKVKIPTKKDLSKELQDLIESQVESKKTGDKGLLENLFSWNKGE
ncbi:MAG: molecular chaperone DnaJ [Candidatus Caenarcaniphilales bacterium]|nr:molecular chaperone DnaJ [Candidatus Caenarcaniphilales bacterium]